MSLQAGNPTFADDLSLIALSPHNLQKLVDIVYIYCREWLMNINVSKSNIVVFSKRRRVSQVSIMYGDSVIPQDSSAEHLGIHQQSNLSLGNRIEKRLQKGKNAFFSMVLQGVHPAGINPVISADLYRKIIVPTALYGCELWNNMTQKDITNIDKFQHFIAKKIQGYGIRTRSDIAESMLGLYRLCSEIDKRKLLFLHKVLSLPSNCLTKEIFIRKYYLYVSSKSAVSYGFIPDVCKLLQKYNLTEVLNHSIMDIEKLPNSCIWKNIVKNCIVLHESEQWDQRLSMHNDFMFFRVLQTNIEPCLVYKMYEQSCHRRNMSTMAQLWCRPPAIQIETCSNCEQSYFEPLIHILTECSVTDNLRQTFFDKVRFAHGSTFADELLSIDVLDLTLKLMGASIPPLLDHDENVHFIFIAFQFVVACVRVANAQ